MIKKKIKSKIDYDKRIKELEDYKEVINKQNKDWNNLFKQDGWMYDGYFGDMIETIDKRIRELIIERYEKEKK